MRYSKSWNAGIGCLSLTLGARNVIWTFLFRFSFVSSASWLILGGVMSARHQAAIALLRIVFSCDGWLQRAVLISHIRIIHLHGFFFISWASSRVKDDCYMGHTHRSLQDNLESTVHSMFTVSNVFGAWQCDTPLLRCILPWIDTLYCCYDLHNGMGHPTHCLIYTASCILCWEYRVSVIYCAGD